MKILIADDNAIMRLLLSAALKRLGHAVEEAKDGSEAWAALQSSEFPLVISDWMMPDLDGLELCRRVRAQNRADYTYIILLTSRSGKTNYLEAMNAGADDFVTKPFEPDELAARIRVAERILTLQANLRAVNLDLERRVQERTAEASQALQAKSEFLSRASHELRTPMHHILGFGQLLAMNPTTPQQKESVERILASGDHLMKLIDRLLSISSAEPDDLRFLETGAGASQAPPSQSGLGEQG